MCGPMKEDDYISLFLSLSPRGWVNQIASLLSLGAAH